MGGSSRGNKFNCINMTVEPTVSMFGGSCNITSCFGNYRVENAQRHNAGSETETPYSYCRSLSVCLSCCKSFSRIIASPCIPSAEIQYNVADSIKAQPLREKRPESNHGSKIPSRLPSIHLSYRGGKKKTFGG